VSFLVLVRATYASFALLWGIRGIDWSAIVHPFDADFRSVCPKIWDLDDFWSGRKNVYCSNKEGIERLSPFLFFHPLAWFVIFGIACLAHWLGVSTIQVVSGLVAVLLCVLLFLAGIGIEVWWEKNHKSDYDRIYAREIAEQAKRKAKREATVLARKLKRREVLKDLLYRGAVVKPELSALPKSRQTIWLKLADLKARVCRPFQQG
jgi:hypothetical protein